MFLPSDKLLAGFRLLDELITTLDLYRVAMLGDGAHTSLQLFPQKKRRVSFYSNDFIKEHIWSIGREWVRDVRWFFCADANQESARNPVFLS